MVMFARMINSMLVVQRSSVGGNTERRRVRHSRVYWCLRCNGYDTVASAFVCYRRHPDFPQKELPGAAPALITYANVLTHTHTDTHEHILAHTGTDTLTCTRTPCGQTAIPDHVCPRCRGTSRSLTSTWAQDCPSASRVSWQLPSRKAQRACVVCVSKVRTVVNLLVCLLCVCVCRELFIRLQPPKIPKALWQILVDPHGDCGGQYLP